MRLRHEGQFRAMLRMRNILARSISHQPHARLRGVDGFILSPVDSGRLPATSLDNRRDSGARKSRDFLCARRIVPSRRLQCDFASKGETVEWASRRMVLCLLRTSIRKLLAGRRAHDNLARIFVSQQINPHRQAPATSNCITRAKTRENKSSRPVPVPFVFSPFHFYLRYPCNPRLNSLSNYEADR